MFRPRIIPVLLLKNQGLVKSVQFKNHRYIGDPINAVRIFNDLEADELVFLDILASRENRTVSGDFVKRVGEEANMPFAAGGGITKIQQISDIIGAGAEKVVLNKKAAEDPSFIEKAAGRFGSSTITVCMDVKKGFFNKSSVRVLNATKKTGLKPVEYARIVEESGAGELIVQSVDADGTMDGYDLDLIREISEVVSIPVVALGGAGNLQHMKEAYDDAYATALAAGSLFVYHGSRRAVLVNYPEVEEKMVVFL
jgi:cyclase